MQESSQFRRDLISGDWIIIAPGRARRPQKLLQKIKTKRKREPKKNCPFENPQKYGNPEPLLVYPSRDNWEIQIIPNKFPAITHSGVCGFMKHNGPFSIFPGIGHHDLIITRHHDNNFPKLSGRQAVELLKIFQSHYRMLSSDKCLSYISIFHNWGPKAGASIYHPHYQTIATPIIPPDVSHSLRGAQHYWRKYKQCAHEVMIEWEKEQKKRVIYENKYAIVFCPFVSREPFEMRVFPKAHEPYFEDTNMKTIAAVADALQYALKCLERNLSDPDYNFFIHTAPLKHKNRYHYYHWHIEILPKITINAGFELGTGVEINVVDPDEAARIIRKNK